MTHISRLKLSEKTSNQILNSFFYALTHIKNEKEMTAFLEAFLSNTEKMMLAKRLAVVYLLKERVEDSKISETLNVTRETVARLRLWSETKGSGYQVAIFKLREKKLLEELKILALKAVRQVIKGASGRF